MTNIAIAVEAVATTAKKTHRSKVKVKRSKESFRPGGKVAKEERKTLCFRIPTKGGASIDQETVDVKALAKQLAEVADLSVSAVVIRANAFEIELDLPKCGDKTDDQMLSETFRLLDETIDSSEVLKNGLHPTERPSWTYSIGDFIADKGGL